MKDVNIRISREAYNRLSLIAAKRRKKISGRVSIKTLVEEASKLVKV